ncbi:phosphotransferase [Actinomadura verrucosospora]
MNTSPPSQWTKFFPDHQACRTAWMNHRWLAKHVHALDAPLLVPAIRRVDDRRLTFEHVTGRHARPEDAVAIAGLMGWLHRALHDDTLHDARLDTPFQASRELTIPDFVTPRRSLVRQRVDSGQVRAPAMTAEQLVHVIEEARNAPAAIYNDANPRNFLLDGHRVFAVDHDCLTLAPFGYDLAKLITSLVMTNGPLPSALIAEALAAYNRALPGLPHHIPEVRWSDLMAWAEVHHVLTSPYLGRHGYRYGWHEGRPAASTCGSEVSVPPPKVQEQDRPDDPERPALHGPRGA